MTKFFSTFFLALLLLLTACTSVTKLEGEQVINERMSVTLTDAWNKISTTGNLQPFDAWTQEGVTLDHMRFWAGIRSGQTLINLNVASTPIGQKDARIPTFKAGMGPDQQVSLFEVLYSGDGSLVTMTKIEPTVFAGEKGVHFEFDIAHKSDGVRFKGLGWVAVRNDELYAATFIAPELSFFKRLRPMAERVIKTARIKG